MTVYQLPMGFARPFSELTSEEKAFFNCFSKIGTSCIYKVFVRVLLLVLKALTSSLFLLLS